MKSIKIIIADDHKILTDSLCMFLARFIEIEILGIAENGVQLLELLKSIEPEIILLDLRMPEMDGHTAFNEVRRLYPKIKIIIFSFHSDYGLISKFIVMGANGYVCKDGNSLEIIEAIKKVASEGFYFENHLANLVALTNKNTPSVSQEHICLCEIQISILKQLTLGKTAKEIASELNISSTTVNYHKSQLRKKLKLKNTIELVIYAKENGIIPEN